MGEEEILEEEKDKYRYLLLGLMEIEENKLSEIKRYIRSLEAQDTLDDLYSYLNNTDLKKKLRDMMSRDCHRRYMMEDKFKIVKVFRKFGAIQNILINQEDKYIAPYVNAVLALLNDEQYMGLVLSARNMMINVNDHNIFINRQGNEKEMQWLTILSSEFVGKGKTTGTKKKVTRKRSTTKKGEKKDETRRSAKTSSKRPK